MMRKVLVALSLMLAVSLLPSAAFAHAGHDHGAKAKKVKKPKPKEGYGGDRRTAAAWVTPSVAAVASLVRQQMGRTQHRRND
jgi:hypothetical protein